MNTDDILQLARTEFAYDKDTGAITFINPAHPKCGQRADTSVSTGYRRVRLGKTNYAAHRMAFLLVEGRWPTPQIDHINRIKDDNRWENLREVTHGENQRNKGPKWDKVEKTMTSMRVWMKVASVAEQELLADKVGTSRQMLYQYAGNHRRASAATAGVIERVTAEMHKASKGRLPKIYRTDLSEACLQCEYAQKCLKGQAVVSEFPIVDARQLELTL